MRVLITGSCGFVGPYVAKAFSDKGYEVHGLDRNACTDNTLIADITDDGDVMCIVSTVQPDIIIHLAGQASVKKSWEQPELTESVNVDGTRNLLNAAASLGFKPRILLVSSVEVYGEQDTVLTEDSPLRPASPYAQSRVAQEALAKGFDLPIIIARSFTHTGPGQQPSFVVPSFAKQVADAAAGRTDTIKFGNLEVSRDISDVRDVARAYVLLAEKGVAGEVYNVCSGQARPLQDVMDLLLELAPAAKSAQLEQDLSRVRKKDIAVLKGSNEKLRALGWEPKIPLRQTLQDMLEFWKK